MTNKNYTRLCEIHAKIQSYNTNVNEISRDLVHKEQLRPQEKVSEVN
jgi:hypothetical protein